MTVDLTGECMVMRTALLHISLLHPHPANPRGSLGDLKELADSIRVHGIVQPLIAAPHPSLKNQYQLIAGHRRLAAAKLARLNEVPVLIRRDAVSTPTAIQIMLIENCQRADLSHMEKAEAMGKLRESGMTGADISRAIGISEPAVSMHLTLLLLSEQDRQRLRDDEIGFRDAAQIARDIRARDTQAYGHRRARARQQQEAAAVRPGWNPPHFTSGHTLAWYAQEVCDGKQHSMRGRLGKVACGECWESAIRSDAAEPVGPEPERPTPLANGSPESRARHAKHQLDYYHARKEAASA